MVLMIIIPGMINARISATKNVNVQSSKYFAFFRDTQLYSQLTITTTLDVSITSILAKNKIHVHNLTA